MFDRVVKIILLFVWCLAVSLDASEARRITLDGFVGAKQPQLAISEDGAIHVTFGKENGIFVTSSQDEGRTFTAPAKIAEVDKVALGMRRGPRIGCAEGNVAVTAISHATGNLYAWVSEDGGSAWSKPITINTVTNAAREGLHALASDGKSKLISVWLDLRNGKTELWSSVSMDGGKAWAANRRVYKSPAGTICECCHPSVLFTATGEIVVMWRNWLEGSRDMYQATSSDGGQTFSEAQKIGTGTWALQACPMDGGSFATRENKIMYAWRRERTLFLTQDLRSETVLAEPGTQPVVARKAQGFSYIWQNNGNLFWKSTASASPGLLARNAGYAAAEWSDKLGRGYIVWEGADGIYLMALRE